MNEMQELRCALLSQDAVLNLHFRNNAKALSGLQSQEGPTISHHTSHISILTSGDWSMSRFV